MFLAQVILVSPKHIPVVFYRQIHDKMQEFLKSTSYKTIKDGEIKHWYVWSTFLPYVKLLYIPHCPVTTDGMMRKLQLLSMELILFGLQNMLSRENHRAMLVKEGLVDYIVCCPNHVPQLLRDQAKELVHLITSSSDIQQQPPKLTSIVKANVAKMHFGLDRTLSLSVGEIVTDFFSQ